MISSKHFLTRAPALALASVATLLLSGCVTPVPYDYTAFKASRPTTLLVLPPVNDSPDVKATYSVLAQVTMPLGEAGYYVIPVTLMDETFRENGLTVPNDIHAVDAEKLRSIFGADAAVYMTVKKYGAVYKVIASEARVELTKLSKNPIFAGPSLADCHEVIGNLGSADFGRGGHRIRT